MLIYDQYEFLNVLFLTLYIIIVYKDRTETRTSSARPPVHAGWAKVKMAACCAARRGRVSRREESVWKSHLIPNPGTSPTAPRPPSQNDNPVWLSFNPAAEWRHRARSRSIPEDSLNRALKPGWIETAEEANIKRSFLVVSCPLIEPCVSTYGVSLK